MSLDVSEEVEDQIIMCVDELKGAKAIDVAVWRFDNGLKPLLCFCVVGVKMMDMQAKGVLTFRDGRYEVVKQE